MARSGSSRTNTARTEGWRARRGWGAAWCSVAGMSSERRATGRRRRGVGGDLVFLCGHVWGKEADGRREWVRPFGPGLVVGVGDRRLPIHAVTDDPAEVLRDGKPVMAQYVPWRENDETRAELALPM